MMPMDPQMYQLLAQQLLAPQAPVQNAGPMNALAQALRMGAGGYAARKGIAGEEAKNAGMADAWAKALGNVSNPDAMPNQQGMQQFADMAAQLSAGAGSGQNVTADAPTASPTRAMRPDEALGASGNADLINALAPELFKNQMTQQQAEAQRQAEAQAKLNEPYTLGPGARRLVGGQEIASSPFAPEKPDTMSPERLAQEQALIQDRARAGAQYRQPVGNGGGGVGGGNIPSGYRPTAGGGLEFIPGGPADPGKGAGRKAPTEDQAKAMQLYERSSQQAAILLGGKDAQGKDVPGVFDSLGHTANQIGNLTGIAPLTSQDYQRADAALTDLAASYLYSVSGATANPGEVANLAHTLRPRIGESTQSIADKKSRIRQMVDSIKTRSAGAIPDGGAAAPAANDVDSLVNKYLGGQ